jgi:hypothetical protein
MMLLMGMWISFTKNPMKPMMAKPTAVAVAVFMNSFRSGFVHFASNLLLLTANSLNAFGMFLMSSMVLVLQ